MARLGVGLDAFKDFNASFRRMRMGSEALIIDTHADIQELVKSGMEQATAETLVRQRVRLLESNIVTKDNIDLLRQETARLTAAAATKIIKCVVVTGLAAVGLVIAAIKYL